MVTQFQFIGWPEQGRPDTSQGVLQMAESINAVQRSTGNKPITVICKWVRNNVKLQTQRIVSYDFESYKVVPVGRIVIT